MMEQENLAVIGVAIVAIIAVFMMFGFSADAGVTGNVTSDISPSMSIGALGRIVFAALMIVACVHMYRKG